MSTTTRSSCQQKMVNKVLLKRPMIRRFTVEVVTTTDDDDSDDGNDDIQVIVDHNSPSKKFTDRSPMIIDGVAHELTNFTVLVKTSGQMAKRYVDTDDGFVPINGAVTPLDQLISCHDLDQMQDVLEVTTLTKDNEVVATEPVTTQSSQVVANTKDVSSDRQAIVIGLEVEGIYNIINDLFKCKVCAISMNSIQTALKHSLSDDHMKIKFGDDLKGLDAQFTIDSPNIGDVEVAIARHRELKKISLSDKQKYWSHGIRLKDGFGVDAYICSTCDLTFESLKDVKKHMKNVKPLEGDIGQTVAINKSPPTATANKIDLKLKNEGIKLTDSDIYHKFYCYFCNIYFDCKKTAISHTSDTRHKATKRGENISDMDAKFAIQTDRIDEFEVAFARRHHLKTMSTKTKTDLTREGIRLKDGTGPHAFYCQKCELSIDNFDDLQNHIQSAFHMIV